MSRQYTEALEAPSAGSIERDARVYVTIQTSAYSGATLLGRLLGGHPEIATIGEMNGLVAHNDPETYLCSCGRRIKDCEFWKSVTAGLRKRGFEFDVADFAMAFRLGGPLPLQYLRKAAFRSRTLDLIRNRVLQHWPGEQRQMQALVARNRAFIDTVLELTGKRVFVDTSKDRIRFRALRRHSDLDVRVIHLVRDVRGVIVSRLRRGRVPNGIHQAAHEWCQIHQKIEALRQLLPADRYIRVRYEDICADVRGNLERLYHFCGVSPDVDPSSLFGTPQHMLGNPMRLSELKDFRDIRLDERWRSELTSDDLKAITSGAGNLIRHYGYL